MINKTKLEKLVLALEQEIGIENDVEMPIESFEEIAHTLGLKFKRIFSPVKIVSVLIKPNQKRNYITIERIGVI